MTEFSTINYGVEDKVAVIALNRAESRNSLNHEMRMEFYQAIRRASIDNAVRVVVIRAEGKSFCAGADLAEFSPENPQVSQRGFVTHLIRTEYNPILTGIAESPKLFVAAVQGAAAGIGASIALACDLTVMAEDAFLYSAFGAIGLVPDGGLHWHLARFLGPKKAYEMIVESQRLDARRCEQLGMANRVVGSDQLESDAMEWAKSLAQQAPMTMRYSKQLLHEISAMTLQQCMDREALIQDAPFQSADFREGVQAFMEKRPPQFTGK